MVLNWSCNSYKKGEITPGKPIYFRPFIVHTPHQPNPSPGSGLTLPHCPLSRATFFLQMAEIAWKMEVTKMTSELGWPSKYIQSLPHCWMISKRLPLNLRVTTPWNSNLQKLQVLHYGKHGPCWCTGSKGHFTLGVRNWKVELQLHFPIFNHVFLFISIYIFTRCI